MNTLPSSCSASTREPRTEIFSTSPPRLAAPIIAGGRVVASIGFAAPTARHSDSAVRSLAKLVCEAARDSESRLDSTGAAAS